MEKKETNTIGGGGEMNPSLHFAALLLIISSAASAKTSILRSSDRSSFQQCLQSSSLPSRVLLLPENSNYAAVFFSSIRNNRTLLSSPKPLLIIAAEQASHVSAAVLCSKQLGIPLRLRSGGHDFEGLSYTSTGSSFVLLELSGLRSIAIDPSHGGTAWVDAGATLGELFYAIAAESSTLAFPAGLCPTVGIGGHISGGGLGTMMRAHGLAADNVVDARIVTADGEVLDRESMGEELFWAIRSGGGASFGVILSYKLKLVEVPPMVTVFNVDRNLRQGATRILSRWQQIAYKLDKRLFIRVELRVVYDEAFGGNKTLKAAFQCLFLGEASELLLLMAKSFPELGLEAKNCLELSWIRSVMVIAGYPHDGPVSNLLDRNPNSSQFFKKKSDFLRDPVGEEEWEAISTWILGQDEEPIIIIDPFGGKMDEIDEAETPCPHRKGSLYSVEYIVSWEEQSPEAAKKHVDWMRKFYEFMALYVSEKPRAAFSNYRDLDLGTNLGRNTSYAEAKAWGEKYFMANFRRLAEVKAMVDPENLFWNAQSVPPLSPGLISEL